MQIHPNVYWIKGKASNIYVCENERGITVVDAGLRGEEKLVFALLQELGRQPADIEQILITHADIDHAGGAAALQAASAATVYASEAAKKHLCAGSSPAHLPRPVQWLSDQFFKYPALPSEAIAHVADGDMLPVLGGLEVLATPGHTLDHLSFYSPSTGVLFTGDAIDSRNGQLNRSRRLITADQYLADQSAIRLIERAPAVFACGHGAPLLDHDSAALMSFFNDLRQGS